MEKVTVKKLINVPEPSGEVEIKLPFYFSEDMAYFKNVTRLTMVGSKIMIDRIEMDKGDFLHLSVGLEFHALPLKYTEIKAEEFQVFLDEVLKYVENTLTEMGGHK